MESKSIEAMLHSMLETIDNAMTDAVKNCEYRYIDNLAETALQIIDKLRIMDTMEFKLRRAEEINEKLRQNLKELGG